MIFDTNKYYRNGYRELFDKLMRIVGISLSGNPGREGGTKNDVIVKHN